MVGMTKVAELELQAFKIPIPTVAATKNTTIQIFILDMVEFILFGKIATA